MFIGSVLRQIYNTVGILSWAKDLSAKPFDEKNQKVRCVLGQSKIYKLDIALVRGRPTI